MSNEDASSRVCNRYLRTLRQRPKSAGGMLARSACASMANGGRVCNRYLRTLRQRPKSALGMSARSACASMANGGVEIWEGSVLNKQYDRDTC
jgi:hypothetical protein